MANVVPSSPILVTLMMEALSSSETSVLTRATLSNSSEDTILHSSHRENLKSYILYSHFIRFWYSLLYVTWQCLYYRTQNSSSNFWFYGTSSIYPSRLELILNCCLVRLFVAAAVLHSLPQDMHKCPLPPYLHLVCYNFSKPTTEIGKLETGEVICRRRFNICTNHIPVATVIYSKIVRHHIRHCGSVTVACCSHTVDYTVCNTFVHASSSHVGVLHCIRFCLQTHWNVNSCAGDLTEFPQAFLLKVSHARKHAPYWV
jgi:hypothetical protein